MVTRARISKSKNLACDFYYVPWNVDMPFLNKHISIESVPGKSYCKVEDDVHIYFIPSEICREVEDYVHRLTFEDHEPTSLRQWYLALPMKKRTSIIVVLNQKIA